MQKYTNFKMNKMLTDLQLVFQYRGKVGYAAARNTRILRDALCEFLLFRDELIHKYGEPEMVNGKETGRIVLTPSSPNFEAFTDELNEIGQIKHTVNLAKIKYDDAMDVMNGEEIVILYGFSFVFRDNPKFCVKSLRDLQDDI